MTGRQTLALLRRAGIALLVVGLYLFVLTRGKGL